MPTAPNYTLTVTPEDLFGNALSTGWLRIGLCNYGNQLPGVSGASLGQVQTWWADIPFTGSLISKTLFGNDQLTPGGTFYQIALLDGAKNVVQTAAYILNGGGTHDLSSLTPIAIAPPQPLGYVTALGSGTIALSPGGWPGPQVTFDVTLTGNATPTVAGLYVGQLVLFLIAQDNAGSHTWAWPANVKNPPLINGAANSVSTAIFVVRSNGFLYPANPTWS